MILLGWLSLVGSAVGSSSAGESVGSDTVARHYLPVEIKRGQHELPSLSSESAPRGGELRDYGTGRPSEYVPAEPLGAWRRSGAAGGVAEGDVEAQSRREPAE